MSDQTLYNLQASTDRLQRSHQTVAAHAAHDLCNQLQVIESALNLVRGSVTSDRMTALDDLFECARSAILRAGRLSRTIVDAKKPRTELANRISVAERLAALPELVLLASDSNILIEHHVDDDVPDVSCDADELDDAILNLVVNARRAMPLGGRIVISATREAAPPGYNPRAVLRIADTGCGMSPETAARAFEPRFTTRASGEGSGLGLAMVADFARSAGGSADLESRPGVGTIVTIRLPGLMKLAREGRCGA